MKTYVPKAYLGSRTADRRCIVIVKDEEGQPHNLGLNRSLKIWNHSPDGFEWGYGGSGPAQLALAILLDYTGDAELASRLHQDFKRDVIATLPDDAWTINGTEIDTWLHKPKA